MGFKTMATSVVLLGALAYTYLHERPIYERVTQIGRQMECCREVLYGEWYQGGVSSRDLWARLGEEGKTRERLYFELPKERQDALEKSFVLKYFM